jgi:phosphoglycerate dehydrogenase-like enzyme
MTEVMTIYVLLQAQKLEEQHRQRLKKELPTATLIFGDTLPDDEARRRAVADADVVFGNPPVAWLEAAPRLRWVQLDSAGADAYFKFVATGKVVLTNLRDFYNHAVSECALAGILAHFRQVPALCLAQRDRQWVQMEVAPQIGQLLGSRVLILGAGGIGQRLATLLKPFEVEILFFARTSPDATLRTPADLDAALGTADIVINTLPQTPQTIGLFDRTRLARFKPGSLLVNVGRGSAVDEAAVLDAVAAGPLAYAILDVTAVEPLPASSPLWGSPRILLLQHTGGRHPGETHRKLDVFLDNFRRLERGDPLHNVINPARGY